MPNGVVRSLKSAGPAMYPGEADSIESMSRAVLQASVGPSFDLSPLAALSMNEISALFLDFPELIGLHQLCMNLVHGQPLLKVPIVESWGSNRGMVLYEQDLKSISAHVLPENEFP